MTDHTQREIDAAYRARRIAMAINAATVLLCFAAIAVFFGGAQ